MDYKQSIASKIKHAKEIKPKAMECCYRYIATKDNSHLTDLGSYLGTFANNLRSALNYSISDYCQRRGFQKNKKGNKLAMDFPYGYSKKEFQNRDIAILMEQSDPNLFSLIERYQPYHPDQKWIGFLFSLSNIDKHQITIDIEEGDISAAQSLDGIEIHHMGESIIIVDPKRPPIVAQTPCYIRPFFALPNKRYMTFTVDMGKGTGTFAIAYIEHTPERVEHFINEFYKMLRL